MFYLMSQLKYKFNNLIELAYIYIFYLGIHVILGFSGVLLLPENFYSTLIILLFISWLPSFSMFLLEDEEDGTLDLLRLSKLSLESIVIYKLLVHIIMLVLPMALMSIFIAFLLNIGSVPFWKLFMIILCSGAQMGAVGLLASSLCTGYIKSNNILSLIVIPLIIPTVIFALKLFDQASGSNAFLLLIAYSALSIALCCMVASSVMRFNR